ncbi:MAG: hypothetical protein HKM02_05030 [Pseudomonadales bacterium]|nr:hypothetical protein [Pseudomonadales bacterium]
MVKYADLRKAQLLLYGQHYLALGTASLQMPGYPYVSLAGYIMGAEGCPLILISELAEHTHNLKGDARCSLLVTAEGSPGLEHARLSLIAEAIPLTVEETGKEASRYYRCFPQMQDFHVRLDFRFFRLLPLQGRFIAGFGRAYWLDWLPPSVLLPTEMEATLISRMPEHPSLSIVSIDSLGLNWRQGERLHRYVFEVEMAGIEDVECQALAAWSVIFKDLP